MENRRTFLSSKVTVLITWLCRLVADYSINSTTYFTKKTEYEILVNLRK